MTLIREGGMQRGRMLRVAAGASPARYSCSKGLAHGRRERSGTWQTGPWGAPQARGMSPQWGVLVGVHVHGGLGLSRLTHFSVGSVLGANCWPWLFLFVSGRKIVWIIDESNGVAVCLERDACGDPVPLGGWPAEREACGGRPGLWECHSCRKYVPAVHTLPLPLHRVRLPFLRLTHSSLAVLNLQGNVVLPD